MSEKGKFTFMETYLETVEQLKEHDPATACELLHAIIEYGLYGKESENPLIKALMVQIKYAIDTWKQISLKNSENGKKGWRPKKSETKGTETEKNPKKANESEWKQKEKENKKENKNNNLNTLSSNEDNGASTEYWNWEINECLQIIKSFNGWMIDWTQKWNRIYWKNLVWKLKESPPVKEKWFTWQETLKAMLQIVSQNKFHRTKITNPKTIYDNLTLLLSICNEQAESVKIPKVLHAL